MKNERQETNLEFFQKKKWSISTEKRQRLGRVEDSRTDATEIDADQKHRHRHRERHRH
jgi:hypothetical protein